MLQRYPSVNTGAACSLNYEISDKTTNGSVVQRQNQNAVVQKEGWKRTKLECDLLVYKAKKNQATFELKKARKEYYTKFIQDNNHEPLQISQNFIQL